MENTTSEDKKPPPLAVGIEAVACQNGHLHLIFKDKDGNELCELIHYEFGEACDFSSFYAQSAMDAFDTNDLMMERC